VRRVVEGAQAKRERRRDRLVAATLHGLENGGASADPGACSTFEDSARFYSTTFPRLTTPPRHIHQLRQTILNIAVPGKLTSQLTSDGKAHDLLARIGSERQKTRASSDADSDGFPETLPLVPVTWVWATVDQIAAHEDNAIADGPFGANLKTAHYVDTPGYRVIRLQNIGHGHFRGEHRSYIDRERFERLPKHLFTLATWLLPV